MRKLIVAVGLVLALAGCSDSSRESVVNSVEGVVVDVDGDLTEVRTFTVNDSGTIHVFVPADGLEFLGGPLSHLSSHVVSGGPVYVEYEVDETGVKIAVYVEDA